jgi:hypothetical protein|nr:MAG TPA_asm: protein of unknown function (DUF4393) [Caudoviricetes sp.]
MNDKTNDLIEATKGVIGEILVEDALPALAEEILKGTVMEAASGTVGLISPRIGGVMVAYQQRRWERNWEKYICLIVEHQDELNKRLDRLEEEQRKEVKNTYFPLISDYVGNEKQYEKIEFIVNGFINLSSGINMQEDITLMYYDTLSQLSLLDLRVLKIYAYQYFDEGCRDNISSVMKEYRIDIAQISLIREKLLRAGLLLSQNDEKMEENINNVSEFIEGLSKNKKNLRLKKINKIRRNDSYKITSYGRKFLNFFTNIAEEQIEE